jgi:hypothetical protein
LHPGEGAGQSAGEVHGLVQKSPFAGKSKQSPVVHWAFWVHAARNGRSPPSAPPLELAAPVEALVDDDVVVVEEALVVVPPDPPPVPIGHAQAPGVPSAPQVRKPCAPAAHAQAVLSPG